MSTNRQVNIYLNSGDAQKGYDALIARNEKFATAITKSQTEITKQTTALNNFKGDKRSEDYKKLQKGIEDKSAAVARDTERMRINASKMDRIQKKMSGELSPSYNNLKDSVAKLTKELKSMSQQDAGFEDKLKDLQKANLEVKSFEDKLRNSQKAFQDMGMTIKAVAIGSLIAGGVKQGFDFVMTEIKQGIEDAKVFEGVEAAFRRLNRAGLLDEMRHAVKGTVNDLELMKMAVQASNYQIPLEELAGLFEFAKKRAQDTGQEVDFLVNSVVQGIGKKSPLVLDNLGISAVRLKGAMGGVTMETAQVGDVAKAVGKIIQEENIKSGKILDSNSVRIAKERAEWENTRTELGTKLLPIWTRLQEIWYGTLNVFGKITGKYADMLGIKKDGIQVSIQTVFQAKEEASQTQKLLDRYENLKEKGIKATTKEKTEMANITYKLKEVLGDSVVAINKETGALEVNIQATKQAIKQKILLSNAELSKVALEFNNAKETKKIAEEELARIEKIRKARGDISLKDNQGGRDVGRISAEYEAGEREFGAIRKEQADQTNRLNDANQTLISAKQELAKYGFKPEDYDFNELAKNAIKAPESTPSGGGAVKDDKKDKQLELQKAFIEKMKDLRRDQTIAFMSEDDKEIANVRKRFDEMEEELHKAYPHMNAISKKYQEELRRLEEESVGQTKKEQEYKAGIVSLEAYYQAEKNTTKAKYANGEIDKKAYDEEIKRLDIELYTSRLFLATEFESKVKDAGKDKLDYQKKINEEKINEEIAMKERLDQLMKEELELEFQLMDAEENAEKAKNKRIEDEKKRHSQQAIAIVQETAGLMGTILSGFAQLEANNTQIEMQRETKANNEKKRRFKQMLDSKRITQDQYDKMVEKADQESARKQGDLKKKQFEADKDAKSIEIGINTAVAVAKAIASSPITFGLPWSAFALAQGAIQLGFVQAQATPDFYGAEGGIIPGPSHEQGGLKLVDKYGNSHGEIEGKELLLSEEFRRVNPEWENPLLMASRTGMKMSDILLKSGIPTVNMNRVIDTVRYAQGGVMPGENSFPSVSSLPIRSNEVNVSSEVSLLTVIAEGIHIMAKSLDVIAQNTKEGIDYEEQAKKQAEWNVRVKRKI